MKKYLLILSAVTILFNLSRCGQNNTSSHSNSKANAANTKFETETILHPVFNNRESYSINNTKGEQITTANGAQILIAPGTFVSSNGKPVETPVDIEYKSMNSLAEIVASGIPMQANNNGEIGQFISDGMFEINATSSGESVQI